MENDINKNENFEKVSNEPWYAPLNKVTTSSKILALIVFVTMPFVGFQLGVKYQSEIYQQQISEDNFFFYQLEIAKSLENNKVEKPNELPTDLQEHIDSKSDLIKVTSPQPLAEIVSPLELKGQARGYWFFEATAPVALVNWDGLIIAEGYITAEDEWMTEDFVSFSGELEFTSPYNEGDADFMQKGTLIFQKSNASGLPEHDDALEIPVLFISR